MLCDMIQIPGGNGHHVEADPVPAVKLLFQTAWWLLVALTVIGSGLWLITNPTFGIVVIFYVGFPLALLWVIVRVIRSAWE